MSNRTHNNGELRITNVGQVVELKGWVAKTRNLGGLIFIDLRDRYGITQIVVNPEEVSKELIETASSVRNEYVIYVKGDVVERTSKNPKMPTGDIEIKGTELKIISESETTPLIIADETDALEDTRLKYRYLDLRRPVLQNNIILRHKISQAVREYLNKEDFLEIETPYLTKSTPEGARDYLVPSRVNSGKFYALPQSPQMYKQLFMVSGFEKYYQIVRCFRDEDLRADRQPEFTQIDIELSFVSQQDIINLTEGMLAHIMKETKGMEIKRPFPVMTYKEAMTRYGSDKPDTRFGMELIELSDVVKDSGFGVFANTVKSGGQVKALNVKGQADKFSRKDITKLEDFAKKYGAKGLAWMKVTEDGLTGPIAKFFTDEEKNNIINTVDANTSDLLLFVADKNKVVADSLGALRIKLGKDLELIDKSLYNFLWVVDWPLFEYDEEDKRFYAAHHPFTRPKQSHTELLEKDPNSCLADAYDVVLNGCELGGGSLRIFEQDLQRKMFNTLGFSNEEIESQFGFFVEAFKYGAPPHGGIALGLDRLVMILTGSATLRDVIAFPKTATAQDPMSQAPSTVSDTQLDELDIISKVK